MVCNAARASVSFRKIILHMLALGLLVATLSAPLAAWSQEFRGTVSGTVTDGTTNAPISGVLVMMTGGGVTKTDDLGRFELRDVSSGTWQIQALRGDMTPPAGEPPSRPITVLSGEAVRGVHMRLVGLATLRGRISDGDGNPLEKVRVFPLAVTYRQGRKNLVTPEGVTGQGTTDLRGEYEIRLPAGKYFIGADYTPGNQRMILTSGNVEPGDGTTRTYYPGTLDSAAAVAITVGGSDTVVANFRVFQKNPELFKLSGTLVGAATDPPLARETPRTFTFIPKVTTLDARALTVLNVTDAAGDTSRFEIAGVPRGSYDLVTSAQLGDGRSVRGILQVEIVDRDIADLRVVLRPNRDVPGKVTVRGVSNGFPIEQIEIRGGGRFAKVGADGTFTLRDVSIGSNLIRVDGFPPDGYVADIRQGGVSLYDTAQTLSGPQFTAEEFSPPLEITLSANGGTIQGVVETSRQQSVAGAVVALVPLPPHRFLQTYYRSAVIGSTGEFTFRGLAPGVYQLYAWERVLDTAWLNPNFIATYEWHAKTITIDPGGNVRTSVRLIPRED